MSFLDIHTPHTGVFLIMSLTITQLSDEPIIVAKFNEPFDAINDTTAVAKMLQDTLSSTSGTLCYIADMSEVQIKFSELVVGLAEAFSNKASPYANPRLRMFTIGSDELIAFGTKAASEQAQYQKANVKLYPDMESALADARNALKAAS